MTNMKDPCEIIKQIYLDSCMHQATWYRSDMKEVATAVKHFTCMESLKLYYTMCLAPTRVDELRSMQTTAFGSKASPQSHPTPT